MDIVVEIHVPLGEAPGAPEGSYAFPWIDQVKDFLAEQEVAEVHEEGEGYGEAYVLFITGSAEPDLLAVQWDRPSSRPGFSPNSRRGQAVEETAEALSKRLDDNPAALDVVAVAAHLEHKLTGLRRVLDALEPGTGEGARPAPLQN